MSAWGRLGCQAEWHEGGHWLTVGREGLLQLLLCAAQPCCQSLMLALPGAHGLLVEARFSPAHHAAVHRLLLSKQMTNDCEFVLAAAI